MLHQLDVDALERRAVEVLDRAYGPMLTLEARGWVQKGIEGMRLAILEIQEEIQRTGDEAGC